MKRLPHKHYPAPKIFGLLDVMEEKVELEMVVRLRSGHPLGCSGSRISTTLINLMEAKDVQFGLATRCVSGLAKVLPPSSKLVDN